MYQFTTDCLIGIEEIDEEHRALFQMINEAFDLLSDSSESSMVLKNLLEKLKEYAATHFAHEEAYMERIHDPELPLQRREHAFFIEKINSYHLETTAGSPSSAEELLTFLVHWLYSHILSSDIIIGKISPKETDPLAFTDEYKTGIELIDNEHRRLFEIIAEVKRLIHDEMMTDKYDEIIQLLSSLREYTRFHFEHEEELMEAMHYPDLEIHCMAHTAFIDRLVDINLSELNNIDDNQQEFLLNLLSFLQSWLVEHILKSDKLIGEYRKLLL